VTASTPRGVSPRRVIPTGALIQVALEIQVDSE
jgi:hypothetical protein